MPDDRLHALEEKLAHLERAAEDLSDVIARQDREIEILKRRVQLLMERAAHAEMDARFGVDAPPANQKPPHW